ncbi:MAG TPA: hypothetical protein VEO54_05695 [Thermoanaerobaculia bacterium]|nr:hypothetical protein [Thermoanaerobaculia bacterium]
MPQCRGSELAEMESSGARLLSDAPGIFSEFAENSTVNAYDLSELAENLSVHASNISELAEKFSDHGSLFSEFAENATTFG